MAAFFVTSLFASGLVIVFAPKTYRSEAKLLVRLGRENVILDAAATLGQNAAVAMPLSRENELNSVVSILNSRALAEQVVDALGPAAILDGRSGRHTTSDAPAQTVVKAGTASWLNDLKIMNSLPAREKAVLELLSSIRVSTARKSDVVDVTCLSPTPELSQAVVAKLVELYVEQHIEWNRTPKARDFFEQQTARLRADLNRKEESLVELKNETGMASPDEQRRMLIAQVGRLEDELMAAEASAAAAEAEVRLVEKKMHGYPTTEVTSRTTGFANEAADTMRAQLYSLELKEQELLAKYTEEHPEVRLVRDQIARSRAVLGSEDRTIAQVTTGRTRASEQAELSLLEREPLLASHQAKAGKVRSQLAEMRARLSELNRNEREVSQLAREVALNDASYRKYSESLEQARIDEALQSEQISNISIVQPASYEVKPARPQRLLTLVVGLLVGSCGSVGLALVAECLTQTRQGASLPS
ncbi:MAG TPA: GNVR domain-containing protein [Pirellulales bacterium]|nr:GNVR domain-containing protein [Pirellulales bacterium]